jgi:hypothetical protein
MALSMDDIAFKTGSRGIIRRVCSAGNGYDEGVGRRADDRR